MGKLNDYLHEKIEAGLPAHLAMRIPKSWLLPLFGDAALQDEIAETITSYKRQTRYKPYTAEFNRQIKDLVRTRDNASCRVCNKTRTEAGGVLEIHHINYNKSDSNPINLITLCKRCHGRTNGNRLHWEIELYLKMLSTVEEGSKPAVEERLDRAYQLSRMKRRKRV